MAKQFKHGSSAEQIQVACVQVAVVIFEKALPRFTGSGPVLVKPSQCPLVISDGSGESSTLAFCKF
jgi:hypothetical protein